MEAPKANPHLVRIAREFLDLAESGKVQSGSIVGFGANTEYRDYGAPKPDDFERLLAHVDAFHFEMLGMLINARLRTQQANGQMLRPDGRPLRQQ